MTLETAVVARFVGGFVGAYVSTGSLGAALTAGITGGLAGAAFFEAGSFAQWASQSGAGWGYTAGVVSHAAVGCFQGVASGGNCGRGALTAAASAAAGPLEKSVAQWGTPAAGAAAAGIVGGAAARLVGGKFGEGFSVGAAGYLLNEMAHEVAKGVNAPEAGFETLRGYFAPSAVSGTFACGDYQCSYDMGPYLDPSRGLEGAWIRVDVSGGLDDGKWVQTYSDSLVFRSQTVKVTALFSQHTRAAATISWMIRHVRTGKTLLGWVRRHMYCLARPERRLRSSGVIRCQIAI